MRLWRRSYPPDNFPSLWKKIDDLVTAERLVATEEVLFELAKKDDEVWGWAVARRNMFVPLDTTIQSVVADILREHPKLVDTRRNRSAADPFVIALAEIEKCAVVTDEHPTGQLVRPNIPDVCRNRGVRVLTVLELIKVESWKI